METIKDGNYTAFFDMAASSKDFSVIMVMKKNFDGTTTIEECEYAPMGAEYGEVQSKAQLLLQQVKRRENLSLMKKVVSGEIEIPTSLLNNRTLFEELKDYAQVQ